MIRGVKSITSVAIGDSASADAFGRGRFSQPFTIFDSKQLHDSQPYLWDDQETSGSGTGSTHSSVRASTTLSVSNLTEGTRIRQTYRSFNYQPGKSQLANITFVLGAATTGITRRVGYFNASNGLFLEQTSAGQSLVRRTNITNSPVDTKHAQADWNLDRMDGTGPSKINLDFTKSQIFVIDFEWLGVGRVRFGFNVNGKTYYCHELNNSNLLSGVYMSSPNLPIRYELINDGTGPAANLETICASVMSEGGVEPTGLTRSVDLGAATVNANTVGTYYAIIGIRLAADHLDDNLKPLNLSLLATTNDAFLWQLRLDPTVAGTFTYSGITNGHAEVATGDTAGNPSTNTVTGGIVLASGYVAAAFSGEFNIENSFIPGSAIDGTPQALILCVTPLAVNLDIAGSLTWREGD